MGKLSATFCEGQISLIIGDNGVGKTTFLYCLSLLKVTSGEYVYNNIHIDLSNYSLMTQFRYDNIYILLQEVSLYDDLKLKDYLDLMSGNKNISYDIPFPLHKKLSNFSLGEKQYILIYGGFLQDKAIYLLDEPTSALDKDIKIKIFQLLHRLKQKGKIVIIITHDQDLINESDCVYQLKDHHLLCQKTSDLLGKNHSRNKKLSQLLLYKTRLYSQSFRYIAIVIFVLSILFLCTGSMIKNNEIKINNQMMNGSRQSIIITSLEKPHLLEKDCKVEPYYLYEYQNYSFINQALPRTLNESHYICLNNMKIEYYQEDSVCYIKQVYPLLSRKQIGYLVSFNDAYVYPSLMKQLFNQYSTKEIQSLYLEKQSLKILEDEKNIIIKFYRVSSIIIILFVAFFYCKKTSYQNINYILLLQVLGISKGNKVIFFIIETMIHILLSFVLLRHYSFEWFILSVFIFIYYVYFWIYSIKDFSYLYRTIKDKTS